MSKVLLVVLSLGCLQVVRVSSFNLTIKPDHLRLKSYDLPVSFTCAADVALAGCQFRWWDVYQQEGPLLELSRGSQSEAEPIHLDSRLTNYSYSGRGLGAGECGVVLQIKYLYGFLMVACRVRAESGEWKYQWADFYVNKDDFIPHNLTTPREVVVLPGGEARFSLETREPLNWCWFNLPRNGGGLQVNGGAQFNNRIPWVRFLGAGPLNGECGLAIKNVTEKDNGPVTFWIKTPTQKDDYIFSALVVAHTPVAATLNLTYTGRDITATCDVKESRPVAKISWVLDDDIIRQDENDDSHVGPRDKWRWPWTKASIQQKLVNVLTTKDHLKDLKCLVSHETLAKPLEVSKIITFPDLTPYKLTFSPRHKRITEDSQYVSLTCAAPDRALTGCQFRWWDLDNKAGPLLDLSREIQSHANPAHLDESITEYIYIGRGLVTGDCRVLLNVTSEKNWMIACRVRAKTEGWMYAWADLNAYYKDPLNHSLTTPRELVVLPGGEARFTLKAQEWLDRCRFQLPGVSYAINFDDGAESDHSIIGRHRYVGAGLKSGDCGVALTNVSEEDNGPVRCGIVAPTLKADYRYLALIVARVASVSLTIWPEHVSVTQDSQYISFTCATGGALTGCQVRWWDSTDEIQGPLLELSEGSQSQADPVYLDPNSVTSYSYIGRGLGAGDCGVKLKVEGLKVWMVACRVRAESGGWKYAWADLLAYNQAPIPHNLTTPREVVVLPGGEARFSLVVQEPLRYCNFRLQGVSNSWLVFREGAESPASTGRNLYLGTGLHNGECGLTLTNISKKDNGLVKCYIATITAKTDHRLMALVVAHPPNTPTLSLTYTGTNVTATCYVEGSRPVADVSWVLGDENIPKNESYDLVTDSHDVWRWPWMQESTQHTLTLQLQPQDNGKDLKCRVSHLTLTRPLEAKITLSF